MSLLTPLGLIGLIGLGILILIYIIKPNFQSKFISSTFIWRKSLKYRKKRIPISKLRNILIFICQLIVLVAVALILAQPYIDNSKEVEDGDTVMILDTSASMHASYEGTTRFSRALTQVRADANKAFENGNRVTIIVAGETSYFAAQQVVADNADVVWDVLDSMKNKPDSVYTYGTPDIEGAMSLAEKITSLTDKVTVTLYTDTEYHNSGDVLVHDVKGALEWNAAILDVRMRMVENNYRIEIDVACYGKDSAVSMDIEIKNVNGTGESMKLTVEALCQGDEVTTYVLGYAKDESSSEAAYIDTQLQLYSYEQLYIRIAEKDALSYDNQYYLYGGTVPTLKVLYYSTMPNNYFASALLLLQDTLRGSWNIQFDEVREGDPIIEGYDLYIYEHAMPKTMPDDGVVLCQDLNSCFWMSRSVIWTL
ncbi:MAG: BatA and WFA domain-containing protein, partial [Clostridia bacterium]|nr:BatA and WFA domain-containing protein [Clostridia bacterium]